jgi:DNA-binding transcriptional regulator YiaG
VVNLKFPAFENNFGTFIKSFLHILNMTKKNTKTIGIKLPTSIDFANICKFIRRTLGVTQETMARELNTTVRTYQSWEYGDSRPSDESAFKLALLYNYAISLSASNTEQPEQERNKEQTESLIY